MEVTSPTLILKFYSRQTQQLSIGPESVDPTKEQKKKTITVYMKDQRRDCLFFRSKLFSFNRG